MTPMDVGGLETLAQRATNVGRRPAAGDYKGAQPPYLADKRPEGALSASHSAKKLPFSVSRTEH